MSETNLFHDHLDRCERCKNNPMDLCPTGALFLQHEGSNAQRRIAASMGIKPGENPFEAFERQRS